MYIQKIEIASRVIHPSLEYWKELNAKYKILKQSLNSPLHLSRFGRTNRVGLGNSIFSDKNNRV